MAACRVFFDKSFIFTSNGPVRELDENFNFFPRSRTRRPSFDSFHIATAVRGYQQHVLFVKFWLKK